jgi:voltage-gated potassium channel
MRGSAAVKLKQIIEQNDTPGGRIFDLFIQALIVISLVSFSIETLPNLRPETAMPLRTIEVICVSLFTVEYLLRIAVAKPKWRFIFSFFGLVDLAAILPFYLTSGLDLRSLRALRLLRLFRAFKLIRYSKAIQRFHRAFIIVKEDLILFGCVALLLLYFSAVGIYYFENTVQPESFSSVFDGLWWAVATLTTVGYGDVYPITSGGRFFTFMVLVLGLGVVAVPTGLVASGLSKARREEEEDKVSESGI